MKSLTQYIQESLEKDKLGEASATESKKHSDEEMDESMERFMSRKSKEIEED